MAESLDMNDPKIIDAIQTISPEIMEPLYWQMEDAIYRDDNKLAKAIFKELIYVAKYRKDLLSSLKEPYLNRLKDITHHFYGSGPTKQQQSVNNLLAIEPSFLPFKKEADLQEYLVDNCELLSEVLEDKVRVVGTEVETDFNYRCDIVAESDENCYPIELKIGQANHAVVSQSEKYCFYFYRRYRYASFRNIKGVVCANGFDSWSINELRRNGIICLDVKQRNEKITLTRI